MRPSTNLSSSHYASDWKVVSKEEFYSVEHVNNLGTKYALMEDCPEREDLLLQLIQCFHGHLMKYVDMILRGHLPAFRNRVNADAQVFLSYWVPKGNKVNRASLSHACRTLHLAFKDQDAAEVYDNLMMCLMRAIRRYDPHFVAKMAKVAGAINEKFSRTVSFDPADVSAHVGFDSLVCIRVFVRRGFLESVRGPGKKVVGYKRSAAWPPPARMFKSGPVGFTYVVQKWFRYYLQEFIDSQMGTVEAQDGTIQLEHYSFPGDITDEDPYGGSALEAIPHADGSFTDFEGRKWAADVSLINAPLDVSQLTLGWVAETNDPLFRKLTRDQRYLLFLYYSENHNWTQIAKALCITVNEAQRRWKEILEYLQARAAAKRRIIPATP